MQPTIESLKKDRSMLAARQRELCKELEAAKLDRIREFELRNEYAQKLAEAQSETHHSRDNERGANKRAEEAEGVVHRHRAAVLEFFMVLALPATPVNEDRLLHLAASAAGTIPPPNGGTPRSEHKRGMF